MIPWQGLGPTFCFVSRLLLATAVAFLPLQGTTLPSQEPPALTDAARTPPANDRLETCPAQGPQSAATPTPAAAVDSVAGALAAASPQEALNSITAGELLKHVAVLADDRMAGRQAGTLAGEAAARYLVERLAAVGLRGAGTDKGFVQAFGNNFRNTVGLLEGSDAQAKEEVVVVGAHYDHLGYGGKPREPGQADVFNGADDNASGVAGVLELAEAFAKLPQTPRRSVMFAFWDGEEKGLLGSNHWVTSPTIPLQRVVFMANLDMIGRLRDDQLTIWGARSGYGLRRLVSSHNANHRLSVSFRWNIITRADHFPFLQRGIPVLFLFTGLHPEWHQPNDETQTVNAEGMQRVARLMFEVLYDIANRKERLGFREAARREMETDPQRPVLAPAPNADDPQLPRGLTCRRDDAEPYALIVLQAAPGSPAQKAGMQPEDRIWQVNDQDVSQGMDVTRALAMGAGPLTLVVERKGQLRRMEIGTSYEAAGAPSPLDTVRTLAGHTSGVRSVAFSPDGRLLASGSFDKTAKLRNLAEGKEIATLAGHEQLINALAFSPDGKSLATGSFDRAVRIWDVATATERTRFQAEGKVYGVGFDPSGTSIAAACSDQTVRVWDLAGRSVRAQLAGHSRTVECLAFGTGATGLASGSWDTKVRFWDTTSWKEQASIEAGVELRSLAFAPDGKTLAVVGGPNPDVKLWDLTARRVATVLYGHSTWVNAVAFDPKGKHVASGGLDRRVILWDAASGRKRLVIQGHPDEVWTVAFAPDGKTLASGSSDRTVKLWDLSLVRETGPAPRSTPEVAPKPGEAAQPPVGLVAPEANPAPASKAPPEPAPAPSGQTPATMLGGHPLYRGSSDGESAAFSPDGRWLLTISRSLNTKVQLWDFRSGSPVRCETSIIAEGMTDNTRFSGDGRWLLLPGGPQMTARTPGPPPRTRLYDMTASPPGSTVRELQEPLLGRWWMVAGGGRWYGAPTSDGDRLWDLYSPDPFASCAVIRTTARSRYGSSILVSGDGRWLLAGKRLLDLPGAVAAQVEITLSAEDAAGARAFSPDGKWALAGDRLYQLASPDPTSSTATIKVLPSATAAIFSHHGRWLVAGNQGRVQVWDLSAKDPNATVREFDGAGGPNYPTPFAALASFAISPDGRWLTMWSYQGGVCLYDLTASGIPPPINRVQGQLGYRGFSADSRWLVLASPSELRLADLKAENPLATSVLLSSLGQGMAPVVSSDGRWLTVTNGGWQSPVNDAPFQLWDLRTNDPTKAAVTLLEEYAHGAMFSPDSRWLFAASCGRRSGTHDRSALHTAHLWDLSSKPLQTSGTVLLQLQGDVRAMAISPSSRWLVTLGGSEALAWDLTVVRNKALSPTPPP